MLFKQQSHFLIKKNNLLKYTNVYKKLIHKIYRGLIEKRLLMQLSYGANKSGTKFPSFKLVTIEYHPSK